MKNMHDNQSQALKVSMKFKVFYIAMLFFCYIEMMKASNCNQSNSPLHKSTAIAQALTGENQASCQDGDSAFAHELAEKIAADESRHHQVLQDSWRRLQRDIRSQELKDIYTNLSKVTTTYDNNGKKIYKPEDQAIGKQLNATKIELFDHRALVCCCCFFSVINDPTPDEIARAQTNSCCCETVMHRNPNKIEIEKCQQLLTTALEDRLKPIYLGPSVATVMNSHTPYRNASAPVVAVNVMNRNCDPKK